MLKSPDKRKHRCLFCFEIPKVFLSIARIHVLNGLRGGRKGLAACEAWLICLRLAGFVPSLQLLVNENSLLAGSLRAS